MLVHFVNSLIRTSIEIFFHNSSAAEGSHPSERVNDQLVESIKKFVIIGNRIQRSCQGKKAEEQKIMEKKQQQWLIHRTGD